MTTKHMPCPVCPSSDAYSIFDNGSSKCFSCGHHTAPPKSVNHTTVPKSMTLRKLNQEPVGTSNVPDKFSARGVTANALQVTGTTVEGNLVTYRSYDPTTNALTGSKTKNLSDGSQGTSGDYGMMGVVRPGGYLILTEGESDALVAVSKFPTYSVLCVPGAQRSGLVKQSLNLIRKYKRIYLAFDNDTAGSALTEKVVSMLPGHKTYVVNLPDGVKDISDAVLAGHDLAKLFNKGTVQGQGLLTNDTDIKTYLHDETTDSFSTGFECVDNMLGGGLHPTEVLGLVGQTGRGKSTFAAQVLYNVVANSDVKAMFVATEMTSKQVARKFASLHIGKRWKVMTADEKQEGLSWVLDRVLFNRYSLTDIDELYDAAVESILQDDVRVICVDVVNDIDGFTGDWEKAAAAILKLKMLADGDARENIPPTAVITVCHTVKSEEGVGMLESIKGGSAIRQRLTAAIGLLGEVSDEKRKIVQLKQSRNFSDGYVEPGALSYNPTTTRCIEVEPDAEQERETNNTPRRKLSQSSGAKRSLSVASAGAKPIPTTLDSPAIVEEVPGASESARPVTVNPPEQPSMQQVHTGLPSTEDTSLSGSEGTVNKGGQVEVTGSEAATPRQDHPTDAVLEDVIGHDKPLRSRSVRDAKALFRKVPTKTPLTHV